MSLSQVDDIFHFEKMQHHPDYLKCTKNSKGTDAKNEKLPIDL